jgi:splicing factor 3A subunit 3
LKEEKKMSSTLLEVTRSAHEDVERLERLIVKDLQNEPPSNKDRLFQSHRVRQMIDTIISTSEKLVIILPFIFHFYIFFSYSKY